MDPKRRWHANTPQLLSPMSTNTSLPPSLAVSMRSAWNGEPQTVESAERQSLSDFGDILHQELAGLRGSKRVKTYKHFLHDQDRLFQRLSAEAFTILGNDANCFLFPDNLSIHPHVLHCVSQ